MKKMIFLCLLLSGCCAHHYPAEYVCQPPRTIYVEVPVYAPAPAPAPRVIQRTVKRTVQIVPASQLKGAMK